MPKKESLPELAQWVESAQKGDAEAFGKVYDALVKPVYRYIYYRVEPQLAEDLTEEAFLKAWQNLGKYTPKAPFSAWVFRIAHNLICDHYRRHNTEAELDERLADDSLLGNPARQAELRLSQITLRKAIRRLPPAHQEIISLKYMGELENWEIAKATGRSEGAIRLLQHRALKQLRIFLEGEG